MAISKADATGMRDDGAGHPGRLLLLDALRALALVAMATYHTAWDFEFFGYLAPGTTGSGLWKVYARVIAGSFLFLAGFSLVLGHGEAIRMRSFAVRFAKVAGAALLISIATWFAMPDAFIFFGILHAIATASVIGLLFLRLPVALTFVFAAAAIAAPFALRADVFNVPALWWVGLTTMPLRSNDYVPLLPWLGPFLAGIGMARLATGAGWLVKAEKFNTAIARRTGPLLFAGRHSLIVYLVHQPVLIGLVYLISIAAPPAQPDPKEAYQANCVAACSRQPSGVSCDTFCACTLDALVERNLFDALNAGSIDINSDERIGDIAAQCTLAPPEKE